MININKKLEKFIQWSIFGSIFILSIGLLTSTTLLALSHVLMIIPGLYFVSYTDYKKLPTSAWFLIALTVVIVLSVIFNQDVSPRGYAPALKSKYFLFGFLSIVPLQWYFQKHFTEKKASVIIYIACFSATFATVAGLIGLYTGYNPVLMKIAHPDRNSGLFGMLMNYAHNLSFFLILLIGLLLQKDKIKSYINSYVLYGTLIINLVGFYYTYTRGAWLALLAGIPFYFFQTQKKLFLKVVVGAVAIGFITYLLAGKSMQRADNDQSRIHQWQAATYAFMERPVLGFGYLNFENNVLEIKKRHGLGDDKFKGHAHNNFFEMLGSTGILGLVCLLLWIGFWFYEGMDQAATIPFIVTFVVGGLTQSTISLGINLFFIIAIYSATTALRSGQKQLYS